MIVLGIDTGVSRPGPADLCTNKSLLRGFYVRQGTLWQDRTNRLVSAHAAPHHVQDGLAIGHSFLERVSSGPVSV